MSAFTRAASACRHSLTALAAMGSQLTDEQWNSRTDCPQWSVGDIYAHIVGVEQWVAEGTPASWSEGPQRWIDQHVADRRGVDRAAVLDELQAIIRVREPRLTDQLPDADAPAWWPWRQVPMPHSMMLQMRAFDLWVHEQDIRRAIGRPGNLGSIGARVTRDVILLSLPKVVAKSAGASPGTTVRITTLGEVPGDFAVHVDADGRGMLMPTDAHPSNAHLTLGWDAFAQLCTGRGERSAHQVWLGGDVALAESLLEHLNIAP